MLLRLTNQSSCICGCHNFHGPRGPNLLTIGPGMAEFRYPMGRLWGDVARASVGIAVCGALAAAMPYASVQFFIFAGLTAVFLWYCLLTVKRARMRIVLSGEGLSISPGQGEIVWRELAQMRLVYYSTRRDREDGWMQLELADTSGRKLRLDSRADGFDVIARAAARGAAENALELDEASVHNLRGL